MVAQQCEKRGNKAEAVEFKILAGKKEEAFTLAQSSNQMDAYVLYMKDMQPEERLKIATYYQGKSQWLKAAQQYE